LQLAHKTLKKFNTTYTQFYIGKNTGNIPKEADCNLKRKAHPYNSYHACAFYIIHGSVRDGHNERLAK